MPASMERLMRAVASSCPVFQTELRGSDGPVEPKVITPNERRETIRPVLPRREYFIAVLSSQFSAKRLPTSLGGTLVVLWSYSSVRSALSQGSSRHNFRVASICSLDSGRPSEALEFFSACCG